MSNESVFEVIRDCLSRYKQTQEGKDYLKRYDQEIGFDILGEDEFMVEVKDGKVKVEKGRIPWPTVSWDDFSKYTKITSERDTMMGLLEGKIRPVDVLVPEWGQPSKLHITFLWPKVHICHWILNLLRGLLVRAK